MNAPKYKIDFDAVVSTDNKTIRLMKNNTVILERTGPDANVLRRKLIMLQDVIDLGFRHMSLEYDGELNEWYELPIVAPSDRFEGVTLMYFPEADYFQYFETGMRFTELAKVECFIKSFDK